MDIWKSYYGRLFPFRELRILDAANLVNQLETKLYSHTDVHKSSIAAFKNQGFYCFNRRLPIVYIRRNTDIARSFVTG